MEFKTARPGHKRAGNTSEFGLHLKKAEAPMSLVYTCTMVGKWDIYLQSPIASSPPA
jgi:hypothetical protein